LLPAIAEVWQMNIELDSQDRQLLELMQQDASLSVADLADKVAISKSACWRRIQKFEESGVIRQRVTLLNPAKLGLGLTVFVTIRTNQHNAAWAEKFNSVVQSVEGVLEVYRLGGQIDYLLKAVVPDMPGYDRLYQKLIDADLFDVTASFVMEEIKATTVLPIRSSKPRNRD
jgi:Lrp/AsnC family transcriptional regulator